VVENEKINKNREAQCNIFRSLLIAFQHTQTHTHTYTYAHKNSQPAACQREDRKGVGGHSGVRGLWRRGRRGGRLYTTTPRYRRGGITRGVLHYRGRDGIPGDMGRGFARRRPFDFDFETIMRGVGEALKRRQWWHGTTGEVTEHTKMADTLGSFVRPGDNLTLNPLPPPFAAVAFRIIHPHTHARHGGIVDVSHHRRIYSCYTRYYTSTATSLSIRRVSRPRECGGGARTRAHHAAAECVWKRFLVTASVFLTYIHII